jgi:hypothetical protein
MSDLQTAEKTEQLMKEVAKVERNFWKFVTSSLRSTSSSSVTESDPNERNMTTGRHIVRDIHCRQCKETVGWKYDKPTRRASATPASAPA